MKNIVLLVIFTLVSGQVAFGQSSDNRRSDSPTDRSKRSGIGANSKSKGSSQRQGGKSEDARRSIRGASGQEIDKNIKKNQLGEQQGRAECGRPPNKDGGSSGEDARRPNLRAIIKRELELTDEQEERLHKIRKAWHKAVKEITGGKKIFDLSKGQKEKLANAWDKFQTVRAKLLSKEQLAKLNKILKKHREIVAENREQGGRELQIGTLSDELATKAKSLSTEYLIFAPTQQPKKPIPLLIYLHGAGGVGDDIRKIRGQAEQLWKGTEKYNVGPCIVVAPQATLRAKENGGWVPSDLNFLLGHLIATLKVDVKRIYLTGNSMGGYGSWVWGGHHPEHFAAIAPVSGGIGSGGPKDVSPDIGQWATKLATVPLFAFAGGKDKVVPADRSQRMISAITEAGGNDAKIKIYSNEGHNVGRSVYGSGELYDWMFRQKRP